jgi:hypothetical protein
MTPVRFDDRPTNRQSKIDSRDRPFSMTARELFKQILFLAGR